MKKKNYWADYNGPGKGITEKQVEEILARYGIRPRDDGCYHREDFEEVWAKMDRGEIE